MLTNNHELMMTSLASDQITLAKIKENLLSLDISIDNHHFTSGPLLVSIIISTSAEMFYLLDQLARGLYVSYFLFMCFIKLSDTIIKCNILCNVLLISEGA